MASITKRGKVYCVVYSFVNDKGEKKQKWETCHSYKEAQKRKAEIESSVVNDTFTAPSKQTVAGFLEDFVSLYGEKKWGVSMYESSCQLIANYVNPIIGHLEVQSITPRTVDMFVKKLQETPSVVTRTHKPTSEYVTPANIEKIVKLLRCAFKQAVRWELVPKNPFDNTVLPKVRSNKRDIWDAETIRRALDACRDSKLYIAMNLSFACSLRLGEILGLTWDNVHISDEEIAADDAWIYVDKELVRASKLAIKTIGTDDIYHIFEPAMQDANTCLILKHPKTESSVRKVWLPKTVAYILRRWREAQTDTKEFLGDEYQDYNLVIAYNSGRPCDPRMIEKAFAKLKVSADLPNVVFHSLRHSSTTYKLKLNHGDLKATQGDTGHAEIDMITKVYAHILDEDRKINAQKFESSFYSNPDLREVRAPKDSSSSIDLNALIAQIQNSPELADALAAVIHRSRNAS